MPSIINPSFLSTVEFRFSMKRLPATSFFIQAATLPGISMGVTEFATPFKTIHLAGDKINYDDFSITMKVDEDLKNYKEIFNWIVGLTKPESFDQYKKLKESEDSLYSDGTLIISDSRSNANIVVDFHDMFPVSLGSIQFDTKQTDIDYATCDVTFKHNGFTIS